MATTVYGNTVQSVWRAYIRYELTNETNTSVDINAVCGMQSIAWGINIHGFRAAINVGDSTSTETYDTSFYSANGATVSTDQVRRPTKTYTKTTSTQSVHIQGRITNNTGYKNGESFAEAYVTIPALASYTVSYNANGGSGAPSSQTKWYGKTLVLSSTKPTRTGYTFQGWGTSSSTSTVSYAPGANYTSNSSTTLYAVWKANTFTIKYDANGGTGAPSSQTKTYGVTLTLSSTKPTRTNYNFLGWSTSATATTATYAAGASFTIDADTTLYAVWSLAYTAPRITNLTADRCNSSGTLSDEGTYAKIGFSWATDKTVSSVKIVCNGTTTTVTSSGTSGTVSKVVGSGKLDSETSYTVTVTVADSSGSSSASVTIAPMHYILDFSPEGGVGIGGVAPSDDVLQVDLVQKFLQPRWVSGSTGTSGTAGYVKLCTITQTSTYRNQTQEFVFSRRKGMMTKLFLTLASANNTTTSVNAAITIGSANVYTVCSSNTCEIWVQKSEAYDNPCLVDFYANPFYGGLTYSFDTEFSSSLPSGATAATKWFDKTSSKSYMEFASSPRLANGVYLAGLNSSSSVVNLIGINEDDRVELDWTTGGFGGRAFKKIWSGSWSSGSISVPDLPYYNFIMVRQTSASGTFPGLCCLMYRNNATANPSGVTDVTWYGGVNLKEYINSKMTIHTMSFQFAETDTATLRTMDSGERAPGYDIRSDSGYSASLNVQEIYGVI